MNVFRKGDDFILITEVPGIKKSDLDVQVKGNTIRLAGTKSVSYPEKAGVHRRERLAGRFDRAVTCPVEIDPDGVKAECRDGILALFLPRAERDKPKSIQVADMSGNSADGGNDGNRTGTCCSRQEGTGDQGREDCPRALLRSVCRHLRDR